MSPSRLSVLLLAAAVLGSLAGCGRSEPRPRAKSEPTGKAPTAVATKEPEETPAPKSGRSDAPSRWKCEKCSRKYDAAGWCCGTELRRS